MYWIEDRYERAKLKEEAAIAIDRLQAIIKECDLPRACVPYLKKKADGLKQAVDYIVDTVKEADESGEGVVA